MQKKSSKKLRAMNPASLANLRVGPGPGRPPADDPLIRVAMSLTAAQIAAVDALAAARGVGRRDVLREFVRAGLERS